MTHFVPLNQRIGREKAKVGNRWLFRVKFPYFSLQMFDAGTQYTHTANTCLMCTQNTYFSDKWINVIFYLLLNKHPTSLNSVKYKIEQGELTNPINLQCVNRITCLEVYRWEKKTYLHSMIRRQWILIVRRTDQLVSSFFTRTVYFYCQ